MDAVLLSAGTAAGGRLCTSGQAKKKDVLVLSARQIVHNWGQTNIS